MVLKNLASLMSKKNMDQVQLAKKSGLTQGTISHILTGRRTVISFDTVMKLAKGLKVSLDELAGLKSRSRVNPLPVISKVIGSPEGAYYTDQDFVAGAGEDYYNVDDENAFVLTVEGDSMEPTIRAGDRVIVTPNKPHKTGDICIVRLANSGKTFLKRIEIHGDNVLLKSENSRYETMVYKRKEIGFIYRVEAIIPR